MELSHGLVAALVACASPAAWAETFALGALDGSDRTFALFNDGLYGPVDDSYTFSVGAGQSYLFDAVASTENTNRSGIRDFAGTLYRGTMPLAEATASAVPAPVWWQRQLDFEPLALGPGDYRLRLYGYAGTPFPTTTYTMAYGGTMTLSAVAAPIPEPGTWALFGAGALGLILLRRRGASSGV